MKTQNDSVESLFTHGVDKAQRRIFLFDDVDNSPIGLIIKAIYLMDSESKKPIELIVGSYGGCEYDMFALYDVIQHCKAPVHTIAIGKCMSAAPLLVACGKKGFRFASPNTSFMVHQGHGDLAGKTDEVKSDLEHWNTLEKRWLGLMEFHSKRPATFWKTQCEKVGDKYFEAEQAKEWGLIDKIWGKTK
jgi:ATP-dependent Clp protease protease subunit